MLNAKAIDNIYSIVITLLWLGRVAGTYAGFLLCVQTSCSSVLFASICSLADCVVTFWNLTCQHVSDADRV